MDVFEGNEIKKVRRRLIWLLSFRLVALLQCPKCLILRSLLLGESVLFIFSVLTS